MNRRGVVPAVPSLGFKAGAVIALDLSHVERRDFAARDLLWLGYFCAEISQRFGGNWLGGPVGAALGAIAVIHGRVDQNDVGGRGGPCDEVTAGFGGPSEFFRGFDATVGEGEEPLRGINAHLDELRDGDRQCACGGRGVWVGAEAEFNLVADAIAFGIREREGVRTAAGEMNGLPGSVEQ